MMHLKNNLIFFVHNIKKYSDGDFIYRPLGGDIFKDDLYLIDEASDQNIVREGPFLVPKALKGIGVESWISIGTMRNILKAQEPENLSDEEIVKLFSFKH